MPKSENKTVAGDQDPRDFLNAVEHPTRRADGLVLLDLFSKVSGYAPVMWGPSIVGCGRYHYRYESGREGDFLATGFSPRKSNLAIYIMPGYQDYSEILDRLGKHKLGKSCLYVNKLADIDLVVLRELIKAGMADLNKIWPVEPS
ncbi:DUF1801 domain-containing protein [Cognatishimia maritima]|uniref:YdhG-like domain-containing protein n=1 Tax=Cognatishimia maritima TaxID=870908 RepID=A0A1M5S5G9_9RHOB|nr:DUF1801 domain-containing protein [Cognatishimia maritima]SHH33213.1 protein of unknown function (DU1801) [Cognatishimia maritima]